MRSGRPWVTAFSRKSLTSEMTSCREVCRFQREIALNTAGAEKAARIPMTRTVTINSVSEKPARRDMGLLRETRSRISARSRTRASGLCGIDLHGLARSRASCGEKPGVTSLAACNLQVALAVGCSADRRFGRAGGYVSTVVRRVWALVGRPGGKGPGARREHQQSAVATGERGRRPEGPLRGARETGSGHGQRALAQLARCYARRLGDARQAVGGEKTRKRILRLLDAHRRRVGSPASRQRHALARHALAQALPRGRGRRHAGLRGGVEPAIELETR